MQAAVRLALTGLAVLTDRSVEPDESSYMMALGITELDHRDERVECKWTNRRSQ